MYDIPGLYPYKITCEGRVYGFKGQLLKPEVTEAGYLRVHLYGKHYAIHRLVIETFLGSIDDGLQVNHVDGCKLNNNLSNLEVVTPAENIKHAQYLGLLTKVKDFELRQEKLHNAYLLQEDIYKNCGVSVDYNKCLKLIICLDLTSEEDYGIL